jgi:hypothetical protein
MFFRETRKRVQTVQHNVFSIGNWHNSLKIRRNCVKYILDRSVKNHHFETELNMSLETLYPWSWELCACVQVYELIKRKSTTSMAWAGYYVHKYELVIIVCTSRNRGESMACHFGLIVAPWACDERTQTRFSTTKKTENIKQKKRDLRHLAYRPV